MNVPDVASRSLVTIIGEGSMQAPTARAFHDSVRIDDRTFIWGGRKSLGDYHSRLELFSVNMLNGKWHQQTVAPPDTPTPCEGACSAAIGNTIYSFGGWTSSGACDELYKLDLNEMRWRRVIGRGLKPERKHGAGMCTVEGKLLVMGGYGPMPKARHPQAEYKEDSYDNGFGWTNELSEFDPHTDCWSALSVTDTRPSPRERHTLTGVNERLAVIFGGYDGKLLNDLWLLNYGNKAVPCCIGLCMRVT
jgi:N-acetylneuraminic acid mutarotase